VNHQLFRALIERINTNEDATAHWFQEKFNLSSSQILEVISHFQGLGLSIILRDSGKIELLEPYDALNKNEISKKLSSELEKITHIQEPLLTINSTNEHLKQNRDELSQAVRICLAEHQSRGRGRCNKYWHSPFAKNIYFSFQHRFMVPINEISGISLMVGMSIVEALKRFKINELQIKWPNDIYCRYKKLGGILIEATNIEVGGVDLIIGIGLNVDMPQIKNNVIDQPWIDLKQITGRRLSRNDLIAAFSNQIYQNSLIYQKSGLEEFLSRWRELDYLDKKDIVVSFANEKQIQGKAIGINTSGELLLQTDNQVTNIHSGDVSVRPINHDTAY